MGFFVPAAGRSGGNNPTNQMRTITDPLRLHQEERLAALAHLYLELQLSPDEAITAAEADLRDLDGFPLVAEAA